MHEPLKASLYDWRGRNKQLYKAEKLDNEQNERASRERAPSSDLRPKGQKEERRASDYRENPGLSDRVLYTKVARKARTDGERPSGTVEKRAHRSRRHMGGGQAVLAMTK